MIMRPKRKLSQVQAEEKGSSVTYKDLVKRRELTLTDSTKLVFSVVENSKKTITLDIRTYITKNGDEIPTRKGINLNIENMEELIETILDINNELIDKNI